MNRYCALLRAVNVGGRILKMAELRRLFEELGFTEVGTLLASGNVLFSSPSRDTGRLERSIEARLTAVVEFPVKTIVRSASEIGALLDSPHMSAEARAGATAANVVFLERALTVSEEAAVLALRSEVDDLRIEGRQVNWLCKVKQSESKLTNARLEKASGVSSTIRGWATVEKIAKALGEGSGGRQA